MEKLLIEGVRCFHERQSVPLSPITFLVGENSTGKSTFLAATGIATSLSKAINFPVRNYDFNRPPFEWGAYDQIVNFRGGRAGTSKSFYIGYSFTSPQKDEKFNHSEIEVVGEFVKGSNQPLLDKIVETFRGYSLTIKLNSKRPSSKKSPTEIFFKVPRSKEINLSEKFSEESSRYQYEFFMYSLTREEPGFLKKHKKLGIAKSDFAVLRHMISQTQMNRLGNIYPFAPIRTTPKRTYDIFKDTPNASGDHVPMVLAKMLTTKGAVSQKMYRNLKDFGKRSEMFSELKIKRLGTKTSDPFQLKVKITGPNFNVADVGYGVSQILPIIVDCLREDDGTIFLLQQPEVHLHPKAQAALGTFLFQLASSTKKKFIVETHSDYIINRVKWENGKSKKFREDLATLSFFERHEGDVRIHNMTFDKNGNINGAPAGYRTFFLDEEKEMMGL